MNITTIGLDIAKNVFHLVGTTSSGEQELKKRLKRSEVLQYFANLPVCLVAIEACGGAHYWSRQFSHMGHEVRLINPKFVKPYLRGQKNDYNDAGALCEAVIQPRMRFVPTKSEAQQDMQVLHRRREGLVKDRTALVNRARGLLAEQGLVIPKGISIFRRQLPYLLEDAENGISDLLREVLSETREQLLDLEQRINWYAQRLESVCRTDEACQRLDEIPGFGAIVSTALVAAVGDARVFKNGRGLSAWMGLVPRQYSTGGKPRLLGITKAGDRRLRAMIIHGARTVASYAKHKDDPLSLWIRGIQARGGSNVASVALANKLVRIAWVVLSRGEHYRPASITRI